jgi:mono/diheme cytochrome c family protein
VKGANGTPLDIPSNAQCKQCHGAADPADAPIGFNAIQLDHNLGGVMLSTLLDQGLLKNIDGPTQITLENSVIPADTQEEREAIGYLHGNCGHCHGGPHPKVGQELWSRVNVATLTSEPLFQTAVCQCLQNWTGRINSAGDRYRLRIDPSHDELSGIIGRMSRRGAEQMPPVGTNIVDAAGLAKVKAWIKSLDAAECDTTGSSCPN